MNRSEKSSKLFEDLQVGDEFFSPGRTITETDVVNYTGISGDYDQLHTDEEYCKKNSIFKTRIAQGLLGLIIAEGLRSRTRIYEKTTVAGLEWSWRFKKPIFIGDTIFVSWKIIHKRDTREPDRGLVREQVFLRNQRNEIVAEGEHVKLVKKRRNGEVRVSE